MTVEMDLTDNTESTPPSRPSMTLINYLTADYFGLSPYELSETITSGAATMARDIAIYLARTDAVETIV